MILGVLVFSIVLLVSLVDHIERWKRNERVNHRRAWLLRATALIPSILLLSGWQLPLIIVTIFLEGFLFWLLFDGFYNLKRDKNWWFLGSVDEDDALGDRIQRKIPLKWLKVLKIGIPTLLLVLYLILK